MRIFVTGATGFIGTALCNELVQHGNIIHALYRNDNKVKCLNHKNIIPIKGDILDKQSIKNALKDCEQVYHTAAFTDVWTGNNKLIYDLNVAGTINVFDAALEAGIKRVVFTSTAGVIGPSTNNTVDENTQQTTGFFLEYERTKAIAEDICKEYIKKGLSVVIVNPTRVYGPGWLNKSNSVTIMIRSYIKGKWRIIPGNGKSIGNYVFINDVVSGHIMAMNKGIAGERYILGGENTSFTAFFKTLDRVSGKHRLMIRLPLFFMLFIAYTVIIFAKITGVKPFITPSHVKKYNYNWDISSAKAVSQLGYSITALKEGMEKTINWLIQSNH